MATVRFIHSSDIHIGKDHFGTGFGVRDFDGAFARLAEAAIEASVAFIVVAGDFFDRQSPQPEHVLWAEESLQRLRGAGIPVCIIEGNHDRYPYSDKTSWVEYLARKGLVRLLAMTGSEEVAEPWNEATGRGAFTDIAGVRVYGAGYYGLATAHRMNRIASHIDGDRYTVLLLHAAVESLSPEFGGVRIEDLDVLRGKVDYLALGHLHKEFTYEGWIHNAGSLTCARPKEYEYAPRGFHLVTVDVETRTHQVERLEIGGRPGRRVIVDCSGLSGEKKLIEKVLEQVRAAAPPADALLEVSLSGRTPLETLAVDLEAIRTGCQAFVPDGYATIENRLGAEVLTDPDGVRAYGTREQVEREELREALRETGIPDEEAVPWVELALSLKAGALEGGDDSVLAGEILGFIGQQEAGVADSQG